VLARNDNVELNLTVDCGQCWQEMSTLSLVPWYDLVLVAKK